MNNTFFVDEQQPTQAKIQKKAPEYSVKIYKELEEKFQNLALHRPMHVERFEADTELVYDVTGVVPAHKGRVHLVIEKFVGGGFAGQVYRVKVLGLELNDGAIRGLEVGG